MKDLKQFYENKYEGEKLTKIDTIPYIKYPTNRFEACIKYFTDDFKGTTILEIAAGNGSISKSILNTNKKITKYLASDLSNNRLASIKNNIQDERLDIRNINVEDFDFNSIGKFDAIIMVALIEHLIDPIEVMKRLRNALNPDGVVYIDTPNVADLYSRLKLLRGKFPSTASRNEGLTQYNGKDVQLFDEGHLHYFTYRSLSIMLTKYSGYSSTQKYYYPLKRALKDKFGTMLHYYLSKWFPELFSALALIARR